MNNKITLDQFGLEQLEVADCGIFLERMSNAEIFVRVYPMPKHPKKDDPGHGLTLYLTANRGTLEVRVVDDRAYPDPVGKIKPLAKPRRKERHR
jgi:hypothetical protein